MIIILLCAIGGAIFGAYSLTRKQEPAAKLRPENEAFVVYAMKPIPKGTKITRSLVEDRRLSRSKVPDRAVPSVSFVIGQKSATEISSGQILLMSDLAFEPTGYIRINNSAPSSLH